MSFTGGGSVDLGSAHGKLVISEDLRGIKAAIVGLEQFVREAQTASTQVSASLKSIGQAATDIGQKLSVGLTLPIVAAAGVSIKAASDMAESLSAVQTVFGDAADAVIAFSTDSKAAMVLTQNEILQTSATLGNLAKGLGLSAEEAATFSGEILDAAADLHSFFNVPAEEALRSLQSGLAGEIEPLRRFGINMSEAEVQLEAVRIGLIETGQEMTESQKVIARQSFILSHMGDATDDLIRTQGSFSNQFAQLQTDVGNLAAEIGKELLPAAAEIIKIIRGAIEQFRNLSPEAKKVILVIAGIAAAIGPLLIVLGSLAAAFVAVSAAISAGAIAALVGFAAAAAPVVAILAGVAVVGFLASNITGTASAATEAVPSINTLTDALLAMAAASNDVVEAAALASIAQQWRTAADAARAAETAFVDASKAQFFGGDPSGMATDTLDKARELEQQKLAIDALRLSDEKLAQAERDLDTISKNTHENRTDLLIQAQHVLDDYILGVENGGISAAEMARQLDNLARAATQGSSGLGGMTEAAKIGADGLDASTRATINFRAATGDAKPEVDVLSRGLTDMYAAANQRGLPIDQLSEFRREAVETTKAAIAETRSLLDAGDAAVNYAHMLAPAQAATNEFFDSLDSAETQAKETAAAFFEAARAASAVGTSMSSFGPNDTVGGSGGLGEQTPEQAKKNDAALRQVSENRKKEQEQDLRDITEATEEAAEKRADAEQDYAREVKDAERDIANAARDSARDMEKATRDANVARAQNERDLARTLADIDQQRVDVAAQAEQDLADLAEQRAKTAADFAERRSDIESNLQQQLVEAEQQFNETQADNLEQQAEIRSQLAESLKEAADQWHEANTQAKEDLRSIREELIQTLKETREEFAKFTRDADTSEARLREDLDRDLQDIGIERSRIQADLAAKLVDPNLSPEQRAQARIDAARALEDLARRDQDIQLQFARDLEDLETQRHDEEIAHEEEEKAARDAAHQARLDQKQELRDAEQAYHDKRMDLEDDAAERIGDLQSDLGEAAAAFHEQQAQLRDDAAQQIADLNAEEASAMADLAEQEQAIYDERTKAFAEFEAEKTEAFRAAEQDRTLIAREEQNARDQAARGAESAERAARKAQRQALRDLNATEDAIDKDLMEQQGDITGVTYGQAFAAGVLSTTDAARSAGEALAAAASAGALQSVGGGAGGASASGFYAAQVASDQQRLISSFSSAPQTLSATVVIQDKELRQYVLGTAIAPMIGSRDRVAAGGMW